MQLLSYLKTTNLDKDVSHCVNFVSTYGDVYGMCAHHRPLPIIPPW